MPLFEAVMEFSSLLKANVVGPDILVDDLTPVPALSPADEMKEFTEADIDGTAPPPAGGIMTSAIRMPDSSDTYLRPPPLSKLLRVQTPHHAFLLGNVFVSGCRVPRLISAPFVHTDHIWLEKMYKQGV
jgi:hypothetical protein